METIICILERRGFLIERIDGKYFLSDNAHIRDAEYLDSLLKEREIGEVKENHEIVISSSDAKRLDGLFSMESEAIGGEAFGHLLGWWAVKNRQYSYKCPVKSLEPNVARYVKALNAAGIFTWCSCDGNHPRSHRLSVSFDEPGYGEFTKLLWKLWLSKLFKLDWRSNREGSVLDLKANTRQTQYDILNEAAKYIYEHRHIIREVRMNSMQWMTNSDRRHMSSEDIEKRFLCEVEKRLKAVAL